MSAVNGMEHVDEDEWQIACESSRFDAWRDEPSFRAILTLSRIVNALNFAAYAMHGVHGVESPAGRRQRSNAFMYTGATLVEAVEFLDRCRADLNKFDLFRSALVPIIDDPDTRTLIAKHLNPLRNRAVFHFDPAFVPRAPEPDSDGYYVFAQGRSLKAGESYYELADRSAMTRVLGLGPTHPEAESRSSDMVFRTTNFMTSFIEAAHGVVAQALDHPDWQPKIVPRTQASADTPPA